MRLNPLRKEYWYVTFLHQGRPVIWRLENVYSESDAMRKGAEKLCGRFYRVFKLSTKDEAEATRHAKALLLDDTASPDDVLHRAKHTDIDLNEDNRERDNRSL
jgi:hypothetical protein